MIRRRRAGFEAQLAEISARRTSKITNHVNAPHAWSKLEGRVLCTNQDIVAGFRLRETWLGDLVPYRIRIGADRDDSCTRIAHVGRATCITLLHQHAITLRQIKRRISELKRNVAIRNEERFLVRRIGPIRKLPTGCQIDVEHREHLRTRGSVSKCANLAALAGATHVLFLSSIDRHASKPFGA